MAASASEHEWISLAHSSRSLPGTNRLSHLRPFPRPTLLYNLKDHISRHAHEIHGPAFALDVDTDPGEGVVRLRLTDEHGRQLGAHQVRLSDHKAALWQGLFDTRSFVRTYANSMRFTDRPATAAGLLDQIGVFLGETVLGSEILGKLYPGVHHRSLLVRQPEALDDRLAAAFARVPWEIARPAAGKDALFERNLVVRMEMPGESPAWEPPAPGPDEPLRVLLVFAEAPGSRPLAMRLEREQLLELFYDEVMPRRRVAVDVLCHGVTRDALRETGPRRLRLPRGALERPRPSQPPGAARSGRQAGPADRRRPGGPLRQGGRFHSLSSSS